MPVRLGLGRKPVAASLCRGGASFSKARRQSALATTKTLMKKYFAYPIVFLFATTMIAMAISESEALVVRETAVWNAFKDKNADEVKKLISTDVVAVYPDGIYNFQQRLDGMSKMTMKSFSLGNFNVSMVSNDVAIVSYKAKVQNQDGSTAELNCGTVWNLRNGEWKAVFHADMAAAPAK